MGGLDLDPNDPVLNQMLADLTRTARDRTTNARVNVARAGSAGATSPAFREAQQREREADGLLRRGDRAGGLRALWSAAALYGKASEARDIAPPASAVPTLREPSNTDGQVRPPPPPPEAVNPPAPPEPNRAPPTAVEKVPPPALPPPPRVEPPATGRDAAGDATATISPLCGTRCAGTLAPMKRWTARRSDEWCRRLAENSYAAWVAILRLTAATRSSSKTSPLCSTAIQPESPARSCDRSRPRQASPAATPCERSSICAGADRVDDRAAGIAVTQIQLQVNEVHEV